ncbi:MAG: enoyl-CoA hydratase/isomerase family protein [Bacteroidetes bacterium]|nr:enoyl-CoA hydratase/isomerase family protein [Bacteroidota bacterium]
METIDKISWEIRNDIGIITLDNPPENYLVQPDFVPIETLKKWTSYDYLKGIIICGAGKHFSGGGKLENLFRMIRDKENISDRISKGKAVLDHLENIEIPVVAAIQGICFGGGLEVALASHIRVCSENALFAFPEINQGVIPGLGGTVRCSGKTSFSKSLKFIMSGDMINAEDALELHLVDYIVSKQKVFDFSFNLLQKLTRDRPLPIINAVMKALKNAQTLSIEEAMKEETRMFCELALAEAKRRNGSQETQK